MRENYSSVRPTNKFVFILLISECPGGFRKYSGKDKTKPWQIRTTASLVF